VKKNIGSVHSRSYTCLSSTLNIGIRTIRTEGRIMQVLKIKKEVSYDGLNDVYLVAQLEERRPRILRRIIEARIDRKKETIPSRIKP
jgi:hypothetical protein